MSLAVSIVVKSTILLVFAAVLTVLLRRSSASTKHTIWFLAIAGSLTLPAVALFAPQFEWPILPHASTSVTFLQLAQEPRLALAATSEPTASFWQAFRIRVFWVWLFGVALLSARFIRSTFAVSRLSRSAEVSRNEDWEVLCRSLSHQLDIRRPTRLLFIGHRIAPMTSGIFRRKIFLPSNALEWSEERRHVVLAHELAHVKRNDGLAQLFIHLFSALHWFNPLVWYAVHRTRIEREHACDDQVLALGASPTDYADHLLQIVRGLKPQSGFALAAVSMGQRSQLETRLLSILDCQIQRRKLSATATIGLAVTTALVTMSVGTIGVTAEPMLPPVLVATAPAATALAAPTPEKPTPPQRTHIGNPGTSPTNSLVPPKIVSWQTPSYTPEALAARIEGTVTLEGSVDAEGKVSGLRVLKGLGYGLDERAIEVAGSWKFSPGLRNGQPVQTVTQIEVDFQPPPTEVNLRPSPEPAPIRVGPGVTPPKIIFRVEPQYTPEARDAKAKGTVVVTATIHEDGTLTVEKIVKPLEYGLTEAAIDALKNWKFTPGVKDGKAVAVLLNIEVNFNLK
jgi:TonB family protein